MFTVTVVYKVNTEYKICKYVNMLAQDRDRWRTLVSAVMNLRVP